MNNQLHGVAVGTTLSLPRICEVPEGFKTIFSEGVKNTVAEEDCLYKKIDFLPQTGSAFLAPWWSLSTDRIRVVSFR